MSLYSIPVYPFSLWLTQDTIIFKVTFSFTVWVFSKLCYTVHRVSLACTSPPLTPVAPSPASLILGNYAPSTGTFFHASKIHTGFPSIPNGQLLFLHLLRSWLRHYFLPCPFRMSLCSQVLCSQPTPCFPPWIEYWKFPLTCSALC